MFKYFKPFIPKASIAALFKMTEAFCDLSLPLIMAKIIDIGVANQNINYIIKMGLTMVGIVLGGYLSSILCNYFSVHATQNFGASLRDNVFTKIQNFNFVHLNKYTQASLITRITKDVDQITNMFLMCIRMVLRGLVTGIGAVFMAVTINPVLSILFLIIVPSIVGSTLYYMKKSFGKYSEVQKKLDNLTLVLRENLTGIRVIRALSKENIEKEKFRLKNDELKDKTIEADNLMSSKLPFITLIMNLGVVAVLWFGGIRVSYGKMHLGEVVAFINYLNMLLFSMNALSFLFTLYSRTAISYKRVKEILSENIENISQEEFEKLVTDDIIEFKNLSFSYDGTDKYILENINLKIKRGENIGIIGGIGTGIGAVFMAVTINPVLSILFLIIVPSIVGSTLYYMKKSFGKYSEVQKKLDNLTLVLRENLTGIRVIRALSKENIEKEKFRLKNDELKDKTIEADNLMSSKLPFITLIMNLGVVAVLWFGGIRVSYGKMHLGEVVAFINYLNMLLFSMNALSFLFTLYSRTAISYKRVKEILSENIENISQEEFEKLVTDDIIEFKNLSFSYDGTDKYILENINLKIKRGENIGIIGGIGSGKTTFISVQQYHITEFRRFYQKKYKKYLKRSLKN